jgi:hypothetical protein
VLNGFCVSFTVVRSWVGLKPDVRLLVSTAVILVVVDGFYASHERTRKVLGVDTADAPGIKWQWYK